MSRSIADAVRRLLSGGLIALLVACSATLDRNDIDQILKSPEWKDFVRVASTNPGFSAQSDDAERNCRGAVAKGEAVSGWLITAPSNAAAPDTARVTGLERCIRAAVAGLDPTGSYRKTDEVKQQLAVRPRRPVVSVQTAAHAVIYVRIPIFVEGTLSAVVSELRKLDPDAHDIESVVVDIRGNPGGTLGSISQVSSAFLPVGSTVFKVRGGEVEDTKAVAPKVWATTGRPALITPPELKSIPMVVLIDRHTSGGAEGFANAMRSQRAAVLVGQRTAGFADVRTVSLSPTGEFLLSLRTATMVSVDGSTWEGTGIEPDVRVHEDAEEAIDSTSLPRDEWMDAAGTVLHFAAAR
jgi:Peptidase family S41